MLQKIHSKLWDALKQRLDPTAEVTYARPGDLVFRPAKGARTVSITFESAVWKEIATAGDDRLEKIAYNVDRYVANAMIRYTNDPRQNAFSIEIDDHALDD